MKVVGVQEKSGEYQGQKYHNYLTHCLKEDDNALGVISEIVKLKYAKVSEVFGHPMNPEDWQSLISKDIRCYFDKFGQTEEIRIIEKPVAANK